MKPLGRLAPTPSGELHLGNITAFAAAWLSVRSAGGELVLRVEDVDRGRARREIEDGHYLPAFEEAFTRHTKEIDAIADRAGPADFDNTIAAMERGGSLLRRLSALFFNLCHSDSTESLRRIEADIASSSSCPYSPRPHFKDERARNLTLAQLQG